MAPGKAFCLAGGSGAMEIRIPDLLYAISRQPIHRSPSPQVTVLQRALQSVRSGQAAVLSCCTPPAVRRSPPTLRYFPPPRITPSTPRNDKRADTGRCNGAPAPNRTRNLPTEVTTTERILPFCRCQRGCDLELLAP
jgi:hypothetical protein